jgi:type I restriction enzyme, S subunit
MGEWRRARLQDVATEVTVGHVGPMVDEYRTSGVPFLRSQNVRPHRIDINDIKYVSDEFHARLKKSALKPGDVVTVRTGSPGQTAVIPEWMTSANCSDLVITRPGPNLDPRWLSYYMNWVIDSHIAGHLVGAVQQHFNVKSAGALELLLPDLAEQRAIGDVLGALDDKIAANDRILALTDEWVRAAYDALSGEQRRLGALAFNVRNQINPGSLVAESVYIGLEHLPKRRMWASEAGTSTDVTSLKATFREGDVLFGKLRPYFHKVVSAGTDGICSTDILVVRANDPRLAGLVLAACASDNTVRFCTASSEGTRMPRTNWKDLATVPVNWPSETAAQKFSSQVAGKSALAHSLVSESHRLATTRDALLPLLMSGKVRVKDAEKVVEEVA